MLGLQMVISLVKGSRPARGAWIEISAILHFDMFANGRALHGARGLKYY